MVTSTEPDEHVEIIESLTAIEFDAERDLFQATYDNTRDSASLAVVAVVATVLDRHPVDLPPLESSIDTDALEQLVANSTDMQGCDSISFQYAGIELTLTSEGQIEADPLENTIAATAE